jgi:glycosyltransferase 2 family protein
VSRLTGRRFEVGPIPPKAVGIAIVGNIAAWVMYGLAFQLFVRGILGDARGSLSEYVAAYALSYVIGYLAFFIPGGLGAREGMLVLTLEALKLATPQEALVISILSRLWLTALEVIPGLLYLAAGTRTQTPRHGTNP